MGGWFVATGPALTHSTTNYEPRTINGRRSLPRRHPRPVPESRNRLCIPPMLAKIGTESDLDLPDYLFEPKLDGIRAICRKQGKRLTFFNRHCVDITDKYPEFDFADAISEDDVLLDGEIVLYDADGNPDFPGLMKRHQRLSANRGTAVRALRYAAFDVMRSGGKDVSDLPLVDRKALLDTLVTRAPHLEKTIYTPDGRKLWDAITRRNLEGVIAKRSDGRYESGKRTGSWVKIKSFQTIDCVVVGFSSDRRAVSALGAALYDEEGRLRFIGKVGTGFTDAETRRLRKLLDARRIDEAPAEGIPRTYRDLLWVRPELVCELRYLEIGSQGMMRNPSYLGLRDDKAPEECTIDQLRTAGGGEGVRG